jgi:hypothetical protein
MRITAARLPLLLLCPILAAVALPAGANASAFAFQTGGPDGKMAMASRPDSPGAPEIEAADDFALDATTAITHASFTGLLPSGSNVQSVTLEIYRVFPLDSNATRTPQVPTRANSPSDVDLQSRTGSQLRVRLTKLAGSFTAQNSVLNGIHPAPNQTTGGEGPVSGREVTFQVTLKEPFVLPAGHYFFIPQVQTSGSANESFYWLSAPKPIAAPGGPFPAGVPDLQAWIRNSALQPDWLRVGTDIVGGTPAPAFNASFALSNAPLDFGYGNTPLPGQVGVRLTVTAPSAGILKVTDPLVGHGHKRAWFNTVVVRRSHAGTVKVKLVPNGVGKKQVAGHRTQRLKALVTFTPTGGQPASHTITITWK